MIGTTPSTDTLAVLLQTLGELTGATSLAGAANRHAEEAVAQSIGRDECDALRRAAAAAGLRMAEVHLDLRCAIRSASPRIPLLAALPGGGWLILVSPRIGRADTIIVQGMTRSDAQLTTDEIRRRIGAATLDAPVRWFALEPAALIAEQPLDVTADPNVVAQQEHAHGGPSPFARLWQLLRPERRDIGIVLVFAVAVGVLSLATPIAAQTLVNIVAFGQLLTPVIVLAILLLFFLLLVGAIRLLQFFVVEIIQRRLFVRLMGDLAYRLPRVQTQAFDQAHGPELVNRFFDILTVQKVGATLLLDGIAVTLSTVVGLFMLGFYHPLFLAFSIILAAAIGLVFLMGVGAVRTAIAESRTKYAVAASLEEIARNPMTFKLSGGPAHALRRADDLAHAYLVARGSHFRIVLRQVAGALLLQAAGSAMTLGIGGWLVINERLTLGQLVAAELIVSVIVASLAKLGKHLEDFYDLLAAVDKIGHLLDLPLERQGGEPLPATGRGARLTVSGLTFTYDSGQSVFHGLDFTAEPGERVAIVGGEGSGKSTLADLLFGVRQPGGGRIEIDGVGLREVSLESLREHVGVVKGLEVFEGSIIDNVRLGRADVSFVSARAALAAVGLLEEVSELADGLQTRLAATGAPLSYGQARRLMVARAVAGRPRLLVLDDVLDDLDSGARRQVVAALLAKDAPWTLLVLTSADDVGRLCDRVIDLGERLPAATERERARSGDSTEVRA